MPQVDVDIDIDDFIYECNSKEKQNIVNDLYQEGYEYEPITPNSLLTSAEWEETLDILRPIKWRMSKEDEETINKIAKKYEV